MSACVTSVMSDPMDCSSPSSSVQGILQARILEWVAIFSSRESSRPRCFSKQSGEKVNLSRGLFCEVVVFQLLSQARLLATPWTAACQVSLSFTISPSLLKLMSIGLMMSSNHHLSPTSHPALNLSQHQGLFQRVSSSHQVSKVLKL